MSPPSGGNSRRTTSHAISIERWSRCSATASATPTRRWRANSGAQSKTSAVGPRHPKKSLHSEARAHDVKLDAQFGINSPVTERSSVRIAHVDSKFKLVAGLLYFRHENDDSTGGELELCRYDPSGARFDASQHLIGSAFEVARTVPYRHNMLVMWVNSPAALHGVSPRDPTPHPRRYINFLCETYMQPEGLFTLQRELAPAAP